jgi:Cu/Ag efflux protein CusF
MNQTKTFAMPFAYWILLGACVLAFMVAQVTPVPADLKIAPGIFALGLAIVYLTSLTQFTIDERNHVILASALKKIELDAAEITRIEYGSRAITLKHHAGKISMPNWGAPTTEFLRELKRRNPAITEEYALQLRWGRNRTFMLVLIVLTLLVPLILLVLLLAMQSGGMPK